MLKDYAVVFQNLETKKVGMDIFTANTEAEARHDFMECYRHGDYAVLSTIEIPK